MPFRRLFSAFLAFSLVFPPAPPLRADTQGGRPQAAASLEPFSHQALVGRLANFWHSSFSKAPAIRLARTFVEDGWSPVRVRGSVTSARTIGSHTRLLSYLFRSDAPSNPLAHSNDSLESVINRSMDQALEGDWRALSEFEALAKTPAAMYLSEDRIDFAIDRLNDSRWSMREIAKATLTALARGPGQSRLTSPHVDRLLSHSPSGWMPNDERLAVLVELAKSRPHALILDRQLGAMVPWMARASEPLRLTLERVLKSAVAEPGGLQQLPETLGAARILLQSPSKNDQETGAELYGWLAARGRIRLEDVPFHRLDLAEIEFREHGVSKNGASAFAREVAASLPPLEWKSPPSEPFLDVPLTPTPSSLAQVFLRAGIRTPTFLHWIDSTALFEGLTESGERRYVAIQLERLDKPGGRLAREARFLEWVHTPAMSHQLWSRYPYPVTDGQGHPQLARLDSQELLESFPPTDNRVRRSVPTTAIALVTWTQTPDSFELLSNPALPERDFREAWTRAVHDAFVFARYGYFHTDLLDARHARDIPYFYPVDWLRPRDKRSGPGNIEAFLEAVPPMGVRRSGLVELGALGRLPEVLNQHYRLAPHLGFVSSSRQGIPAHTLAFDLLGNAFLAAILGTAPRLLAENDASLAKGDGPIWKKKHWKEDYARYLRTLFQSAADAFIGDDPEVAKAMVDRSGHFERLAEQMAMFLTLEYVGLVGPNREPVQANSAWRALYGPQTHVTVRDVRSTDWDAAKGYIGTQQDGRRSLGPSHGPFPIQELMRINFLLISQLFVHLTRIRAASPAAPVSIYGYSGDELKNRLRGTGSILEGLLDHFGTVEAMVGSKGVELGTSANLELFEALRDIGVEVLGVDRAPKGKSRHAEFLHANQSYGDFFSKVASEWFDFIYSAISFYPGILEATGELSSILRSLKTGGALIFTLYEDELDHLGTAHSLSTLGLVQVGPLKRTARGRVRVIWKKVDPQSLVAKAA